MHAPIDRDPFSCADCTIRDYADDVWACKAERLPAHTDLDTSSQPIILSPFLSALSD